MGIRLHVEHIIPKDAGGLTSEENLCLACQSCNRSKWYNTHARDPISTQIVPLFNPNTQNWFEHFRWSEDGARIIGLTPCGRATVIALQLNNPYMVRAREFWVKAGEHPPRE
jgi:hypothetical protein